MINFKNKKSSPAAKQKDFKLQTNICYCKTVEVFCRIKNLRKGKWDCIIICRHAQGARLSSDRTLKVKVKRNYD